MPKAPQIQTAKTMTLASVPEGLRPEEFLVDADLAAMWEREAEAAEPGSPEQAALRKNWRRAQVATALNAQVLETLGAEAKEATE